MRFFEVLDLLLLGLARGRLLRRGDGRHRETGRGQQDTSHGRMVHVGWPWARRPAPTLGGLRRPPATASAKTG